MPTSAQRNGKKFPLGEKRRTMSKVELWEQKQKKKDNKMADRYRCGLHRGWLVYTEYRCACGCFLLVSRRCDALDCRMCHRDDCERSDALFGGVSLEKQPKSFLSKIMFVIFLPVLPLPTALRRREHSSTI